MFRAMNTTNGKQKGKDAGSHPANDNGVRIGTRIRKQAPKFGGSMTFSVHDVQLASNPLPEWPKRAAIEHIVGSGLEVCTDAEAPVISRINYHPLLAAVHTAFSRHQPLVLTPDAVWLTISQGVANHMRIHAEDLRSGFVSHHGRTPLVFRDESSLDGTSERFWWDALQVFALEIRERVGADIYDQLICDFSTSSPVEITASQVVMMDVFERYFHYVATCICGIPEITLSGTPDDWVRLKEKASRLSRFDLNWWLEHLLPLCDHFVRASTGDVDRNHWRNICKLEDDYGGDIINGWVAKLFPYLRAFEKGPCTRRNPIFGTGEGFQSRQAPSGLSRVPITWINESTGKMRGMEAIGGLVGVAQDPETYALRPEVGWAVREAEKMDQLLARLAAEHATFPGIPHSSGFWRRAEDVLRADLGQFYAFTNGVEFLFDRSSPDVRIVPVEEWEPLRFGNIPDGGTTIGPQDSDYRRPYDGNWRRLAWLSDGRWLGMLLVSQGFAPRIARSRNGFVDANYLAICLSESSDSRLTGKERIIALSFTGLLELLLEYGEVRDWNRLLSEDFGDVDLHTRRN